MYFIHVPVMLTYLPLFHTFWWVCQSEFGKTAVINNTAHTHHDNELGRDSPEKIHHPEYLTLI